MAVEFRQRTAGEFLAMFRRRKWHILLPTIALGLAVGYVVSQLPSVYESRTLLTVKSPTISEKVVQSLSEEDLSQRLNQMSQEILSRTVLEQLISKYKLYDREKSQGMPMELVVEKMFKNIKVEPEKGDDGKVTSFRLAYRDKTPENARNVTAELAAKYVNQQITRSVDIATKTQDFIDTQVNEAKTSLDVIEKQRLQIMTQNRDTLPESSQNLIAQLTNLGTQSQTLSKEKETLINEKGRLNEQINSNNRQIRLVEDFGEKETQDVARQASQIENTPAYAQLKQKRAELNAKLDNLLKEYREKHPLVVEKRNELTRINEEIDDLKKNVDVNIKTATQSTGRKSDLQKKNLENDNLRLKEQIAQFEQQITTKDGEMAQNNMKVAELNAKIDTVPDVRVALESIENQYRTAKTTYDDLLKKKNDAGIQVKRDSEAQGETIQVVDPANLPVSPVNASKKPMFIAVGAALGLALGLFLAALFEVPRLFKIQSIEDAKHYTGLPVLASVPPLLTRQELSWQKRSYWLKVLAGIVTAVGSVPLLIIMLEKTRIFERIGA